MSTRLAPLTLLVGLLAAACTPRAACRPSLGWPTQGEWTLARERLAGLRAAQPVRPFVELVEVLVREPRSGRSVLARGAVAVDPHRAMRMVLLGPGGATALDVWTTPERWRFAVPAMDLLRRGGELGDDALPIGFFRWWFLGPLEGRLLTAALKPGSSLFVLRDGRATVTLLDERLPWGHRVLASRREKGTMDRLAWSGREFVPAADERVIYEQASTGVHVEVAVESISSDPPDPMAFADPDSPEAAPPARREETR